MSTRSSVEARVWVGLRPRRGPSTEEGGESVDGGPCEELGAGPAVRGEEADVDEGVKGVAEDLEGRSAGGADGGGVLGLCHVGVDQRVPFTRSPAWLHRRGSLQEQRGAT
jgi:hypothetical protein